ncbi:MAG: MFS transporter [Haloferacaceae archaeon]
MSRRLAAVAGRWRGVEAVAGWQVAASTCFYAAFAATAAFRETFGLSRAVVGLAVTATVFGYTLALFPAGALVDAYGDRPVMVGGLAGLGLGAVAVGVAADELVLFLALLLVGACYSVGMPATNRAVVRVAPAGAHGLAVNIKQVGVTAGSGLGAVLVTGATTLALGWRAGFLAAGALAVAGAGWYALRADRSGAGGSGSVDLPDVGALRAVPGYVSLVAAGFFLGAALFATTGHVVLHMTEAVAAGPGLAGLTLAGVQVAGSAGRLGGGWIADRLPGSDARSAAVVLLGLTLLSVAGFLAVAFAGSATGAVAGFLVLGVGIVGFPGLYYACLTAMVPDEQMGGATAVAQFVLNVGGLVAPPAAGYAADAAAYRVAWVGLAVAVGLASLLLVVLVWRR